MKWNGGLLPSTRLAAWVGVGALLWAAGGLLPILWRLAGLFDLALLGVAIVDALMCARERDVELSREAPERMNLGAPVDVTLRARNRGSYALNMLLRDETPPELRVQHPGVAVHAATPSGMVQKDVLQAPPIAKLSLRLEAKREATVSYGLLPERRGDYQFGALSARWSSPLGLWLRQSKREATYATRVYPDASLVRRYELRLRQGRVQEMGLHLLRLRGRGTEFESLRDYTRDDEFKNINWKASAKRGKLIATNFEVERDQTILLAIDCGRMMTAQARLKANEELRMKNGELADASARAQFWVLHSELPLSKLDCAVNAALLLSHVAASMGDFVGLLLFADSVLSYVPPRKGQTQVGRIVDALYSVQPRLVEPDYAGAYEYLIARRLRRALVVTFTDLIDPFASRELVAASGALRKHHNALCVTLQDSDVLELAAVMPESSLEAHQKAMATRTLSGRESGLSELRKRGVSVLDVPAADLSVQTVNRYLDLKSRAAL